MRYPGLRYPGQRIGCRAQRTNGNAAKAVIADQAGTPPGHRCGDTMRCRAARVAAPTDLGFAAPPVSAKVETSLVWSAR
jgi:hypothetical protein